MNNTKLYELLEDAMQGKRDLMFADVISNIHCMSRARVYAIINAVVSSLEEGEIYVEVGAYQGGSLISALLGNISKAIGVDSFSEFKETNSYEQTQRNLETYKVDDRATLLNMSYQEFFAELSPDFRIRAYYYDGEHNYHGQLAGMEAAWKFLSSGSLVPRGVARCERLRAQPRRQHPLPVRDVAPGRPGCKLVERRRCHAGDVT
jgi:hypothetical protein